MSSTMKICLVTAAYPTKTRADSGSFIRDQALLAKEMDCALSVVVPQIFRNDDLFFLDGSLKVFRFPFMTEEKFLAEYETIPVFRVVSYLLSGVYRAWKVVQREQVELIHAHWVIPTGLIGVVVGRYLTGKPVVVTAHRADINVFPEKSKLARLAAKFVLKKADHVIAVSAALRERIREEYGVSEGRISVINMGVDPRLFRPRDKKEVREQLELPLDGKVVLFAGGLISVKGLEYLLMAVPRVLEKEKRALFILVGTGSLEARLKQMARELGVSEQVRFVGERPHEELPLWISAAEAIVLPSLDEGLPVLLMEALASGVPVIATRVGGTPEVVKEGRNGFLVEPRNPEALAEKLSLLLSDEKLYRELAANCRMPEGCDMESNIRQTVEIYRRVLKP